MRWSIDRTRGAVVSSSLNPPSVEGDGAHASAVAICRIDAIPPGGLVEVEAEVEGEPESLILHRDDAGAVRAWRNICPHAGRRLDWAPGQFLKSKDGLLVACSCSHHLPRSALVEAVQGGARHLDRQAQLLEFLAQGPDHPVHPAIPETEYLKGALFRILPA